MSDPMLTGLAGGASVVPPGAIGQEPSRWVLARWTAPRHGHHRDTIVIIDPDDPATKHELAAQWLVILDAHEQLPIVVDPVTMEPTIAEPEGT